MQLSVGYVRGYIADDRATGEWWTGNDTEESVFIWREWERPRKNERGWPVKWLAQPRYKPGTCCLQLQVRVTFSVVMQMFRFSAYDDEYRGCLKGREVLRSWIPNLQNLLKESRAGSFLKKSQAGLKLRSESALEFFRNIRTWVCLHRENRRAQSEVYLAQARKFLRTSKNTSVTAFYLITKLRAHPPPHTHTHNLIFHLTSKFRVDPSRCAPRISPSGGWPWGWV
jgi:hypothetical protein